MAPTQDKPLCKLYEGDKEIGTETVDYIPEDGVAYVEFTLNTTMRQWENESVNLKMVIDEDEEIPETNPDDNEWKKRIDVGDCSAWYENPPWVAIIVAAVVVITAVVAFIWWRRRSIYA